MRLEGSSWFDTLSPMLLLPFLLPLSGCSLTSLSFFLKFFSFLLFEILVGRVPSFSCGFAIK